MSAAANSGSNIKKAAKSAAKPAVKAAPSKKAEKTTSPSSTRVHASTPPAKRLCKANKIAVSEAIARGSATASSSTGGDAVVPVLSQDCKMELAVLGTDEQFEACKALAELSKQGSSVAWTSLQIIGPLII